MDNVVDNLIHKINLSVIHVHVIQIPGERLLCRVHIQTNNLPHQLPQGLVLVFRGVVLPGSQLRPQNGLQAVNILPGKRLIGVELGNGGFVHMAADIVIHLPLIILQVIAVQLRRSPVDCHNIIGEVRVIDWILALWNVFDQVTEFDSDILKLGDSRRFNVIRGQDLFDERTLLLNRRNGTTVGQCVHLRHQIPDALGIPVSRNIAQFNAIQKGIKAHSGNIIFAGQYQRCNLL